MSEYIFNIELWEKILINDDYLKEIIGKKEHFKFSTIDRQNLKAISSDILSKWQKKLREKNKQRQALQERSKKYKGDAWLEIKALDAIIKDTETTITMWRDMLKNFDSFLIYEVKIKQICQRDKTLELKDLEDVAKNPRTTIKEWKDILSKLEGFLEREMEINNIFKTERRHGIIWRRTHIRDREGQFNKKMKGIFFIELSNLVSEIGMDKKYLNIIVVGGQGAGKSSLVTTFATAFANNGRKVHASTAFNRGDINNHTKKLIGIPLRNQPGDDKTGIRIFDTRGIFCDLETERIGCDEMLLIIRGHIKPNSVISTASQMMEDPNVFLKEPGPSDKMHVIVFVVRADTELKKDDPVIREMSKIFNTTAEENIPHCVVISAIDTTIQPNTDIENIFRYGIVKNLCNYVRQYIQVQSAYVFPISNYLNEDVLPTVKKDAMALYCLLRIAEFAKDYSLSLIQ